MNFRLWLEEKSTPELVAQIKQVAHHKGTFQTGRNDQVAYKGFIPLSHVEEMPIFQPQAAVSSEG